MNEQLDPSVLAKVKELLPSRQAEEQKREELQRMFNTSYRAGAGGSKAGLPGIRPRGLKAASDFVDLMTPGKVKPPPPRFSQDLQIPQNFKQDDAKHKVRVILPRSFCPECDRMDCPEVGGAINISLYTEDREDLGIKAGEVLLSSRCQKCLEGQQAKKYDRANALQMPGGSSLGQIANAQTLVLIKSRTEAYIRANRENPDRVKYIAY